MEINKTDKGSGKITGKTTGKWGLTETNKRSTLRRKSKPCNVIL